MSPVAIVATIFGGCVIAAFTGLIGYVFGNRAVRQVEIDIAAIAPALAGLKETMAVIRVSVESIANGHIEHTRLAGHRGGMERLEAAEDDINRMGEKLSRHIEDRAIHHGK